MPRLPRSFCLARLAAVCAFLGAIPVAGADAAPVRIAGFDVEGNADPPGRLEAFLGDVAPVGSFYVEPGEADSEGTPISTPGRLRRALAGLGYDAFIEARPASPGQVRLLVRLRAYDRIRHLFVDGNWPLRQDEILRRISLRPGQALPPAGPEREERIEIERMRILDFLRSQGYLEAEARIELRAAGTAPARVNLVVVIDRGPGYPVGPVVVRGNRVVSTEEIEDQVRHQDWRWLWSRPLPFRRSLLREDMAKLTARYRALGYPGARLTHDTVVDPAAKNVRLEITVNERKRIEVAFEGNHRLSAESLKDRLTIFSRGSYDDYEAAASAAALAQRYHERGHMLVRVGWRRERLSNDEDRLIFTIEEGPELKVRGVAFVGNRGISSEALSSVVNVRVFPRLGIIGLGQGGYASLRQLAVDVDNLHVFYRDGGFPEARVRCEIAPAPGQWRPLAAITQEAEALWRGATALYVRFLIDEGIEIRVRAIEFVARGEESSATYPLPRPAWFLRDSLLSTVGARLRPPLVRQDAERLGRLLGDEGYPEARAEPVVTRQGGDATIAWQITLGPRTRVGPVFVRGNFVSREDTILQWVPLTTGSVLTTTAVERGQRNLALIQLFTNASPLSFPREGPHDRLVPMLIEVEERHDHFGVLRIGGGASTEQAPPGGELPVGVFASAGYEHRNLFGRGWTFVTQGSYGNSVARGTASFLEPRLLETAFRLEVGGNYLRQATVRLGDIRSGGGFLGLAREMAPGVDAAVRYNLRNTSRTEFLLRGAGPDEGQRTIQLGTAVGSLSLTVDWTRLDHALVPSRGFRLSVSAELALPVFSFRLGDDAFVKASARSLTVVPLLSWLSLRQSVRYDQGFPLGGASLLPKVERFFGGGDTTIRGFELDRARTEVIRSSLAPGVGAVQFRPAGGSLRILHNLDLQFPIAPPWYGAVFLDSGVVADSLSGLTLARFRHGIGVSPLLIKLPVGDISVSWGWPLDPAAGDSRFGRLHFNVGLMF